ncbi:hypothetical protein [Nocardioides sp. GXZ039]|uniref:hypothetical protein n=1 Tax=Nocardioides sp. GXZ039 TaxID=3136018 RepID=UPI0030F3C186
MQELLGRLTALDPEASEALKVVTYFDALVAAGVGLDALLRAAAALSGTVAGAERRGRVSRFDPSGKRCETTAGTCRSPERSGAHSRVWLERDGTLHANDEMVVERLALAVELLEAKRGRDGSLDLVLDHATPHGERTAALARLRINPGAQIRVIATRLEDRIEGAASTVVATRYGMLRATLDLTGQTPVGARAGLGTWTRADRAPESWEGAVVAQRLTSRADPVVDSTTLGAMLGLALSYDPEAPHPDVTALAQLDDRAREVLLALVECESMRAASTRLGMHHSSIQARHDALTRELGYDPRTPIGRMRYVAAALLLRLTVPLDPTD